MENFKTIESNCEDSPLERNFNKQCKQGPYKTYKH